ncbi:MAG: hypothetical protein JNM86_13620 [Phycisphaerae bacterium]|nr:hypothetical protein [Phycisphaerae bacterium]
MKSAVFALVVACAAANAPAIAQSIWSPRINRTNGVATLVRFHADLPSAQSTYGNMIAPANHFVSGLEYTPDGRMWATVQGPAGSLQQGLYRVDPGTSAITQVGQPVGLATNEQITDLSWNPVTHRLTGSAAVANGAFTTRLLNFNIADGSIASAQTLTSPNVKVLPVGVSCRANGEYLLLDLFNNMVARNDEAGIVFLGDVISFTAGYNQGFGTDFTTGTVWYTSFRITNALQGAGVAELRTIDTTTGADTFVGSLGGNTFLFTDAAVEPVVNHCPADVTSDSQVDDADFVSFASQYDALECGTPSMTGGCSADFNFDGAVDDADFVLFAIAYDVLVCP